MSFLIKMYSQQRDKYADKLKENENQFIEAMQSNDLNGAEEIAKKGAGMKMMLDHANDCLKRLNT